MLLQTQPTSTIATTSCHVFLAAVAILSSVASVANAEATSSSCLADETLNEIFATKRPTCCQHDVCGLPCPEPVPDPALGTSKKEYEKEPYSSSGHFPFHALTLPRAHPCSFNSTGFSIAISAGIAVSFLIGIEALFYIEGKPENFFVAGRSLPLWIVVATLGAQSIDSNALLGNADLSYKYHFWDGAVLPIGLGLSLILNGIFLAAKINTDRAGGVLTLPDILAKRYGRIVEVLVSIATVISFMMLLAGNLLGMGVIVAYLWNISQETGIWISFVITWTYTISGGLYSVAYTDVFQALAGWSGCIAFAYYMVTNASPNAPPPSIGFPGYVYPDNMGDGGICDMYHGEPCQYQQDGCCYNATMYCPEGPEVGCLQSDNGAYPFGDQRIFHDGMSNHVALNPFPNAIFWNWSTIFILAIGNLAALDFQARCMAAQCPRTARLGCLIAGAFTFFVGIPFSYIGAITRYVLLVLQREQRAVPLFPILFSDIHQLVSLHRLFQCLLRSGFGSCRF